MKLSELVAVFAWFSTFLSSFLIFFRRIPNDGLSWGFFAFYLIVAILASAMTMERKK